MGFVGQIQKKYVLVQSSEPVNGFDGQLWKDTSSDTLKQYDSSSDTWVSVQSSPDGITTGKNSSGELEVLIDEKTIFNSSKGVSTGVLHSSEVNNVVSVYGSTNDSANTIVNLTLGANEKLILYKAIASGEMDRSGLDVIVDGNNAPINEEIGRNDNTFFCPAPIVVENSLEVVTDTSGFNSEYSDCNVFYEVISE